MFNLNLRRVWSFGLVPSPGWKDSTGRPSFVVCAEPTEGIVPKDTIPDPYVGMGVPAEVSALADKLPEFSGTLDPVPARTSSDYDKVVEANNAKIWQFAKSTALNVLVGKVNGFTGDVNLLFNINSYTKGYSGSSRTTLAMKNCKTVFSRGAWRPFWAAIALKVQSHRDLTQRINPALGITQAEYADIQDNLVYIGRGFAMSARTSQSKEYIVSKSTAQKQCDLEAFAKWYREKASPLVRIVRLNVSDIPLGYAMAEIIAFETEPTSKVAREGLEAKLVQLQTEAIKQWRADKTAGKAFDLEGWLAKK